MGRGQDPGGRRGGLDIEPLLQPGERLLWEGGPDPGVVFARQDLFVVPFSLLWGTFAAVWEASAVAAGTVGSAVFGAPLVALGLYLVVGRFLYKRHDRRRTRYAVTDQRAVAVRLGGRQVLHAPIGGPMAVLRRRDGRHGSVVWAVLGLPPGRRVLTFGGSGTTVSRGTSWPVAGVAVSQVAFFDVDRFEELLAVVTHARAALGVTETPRTLAALGGGPGRGQAPGPSAGGGAPLAGPAPELLEPRRPAAPPAGWYADPDPAARGTGTERWWDGVGWSFHVRSGPPPQDDRAPGTAEGPPPG